MSIHPVPLDLTSSLLSSASINGTQGSIGNCGVGGSSCYINGDTYKAVESSLLIAANIKNGVSLGGVSGAYPSSTYKLDGANETTDLISSNFNDLMVSSSSFEWFDSQGNRYTGTGDNDLVATNIKKNVDIFGVTGSYKNSSGEDRGIAVSSDSWFVVLKDTEGAVTCMTYDGMELCPEISSSVTNVSNVVVSYMAYAILTQDGSVVTWGAESNGGDSSSVSAQLSSGVVNIFSTNGAFAALKSDGSVVTWGESSYGGDSSSVQSQLTNVVNIFSNKYGVFAALKSDGSVVTWGYSNYGGDSSSPVGGTLSSGVTNISSNYYAFAALKSDGSVVSWGDSKYGGNFNYSHSGSYPYVTGAPEGSLSSGVVNIFATEGGAFAALKEDGSVVTWGSPNYGGNSSSPIGGTLSSGVVNIFSLYSSFAALKEDGTVVTWGEGAGGNSSSVQSQLTNVVNIFSTSGAFAVLKSDGTVVTWGNSYSGGDSSSVSSQLTNVVNIFSTNGGVFAALKSDGTVVTWGDSLAGGDSSSVSAQLTNVTSVVGNYSGEMQLGAMAALRTDGSVVTCGTDYYGGDPSEEIRAQLSSGVIDIITTEEGAMAALKADGSVVAWGISSYGGDPSDIITYTGSSSLTGITKIFSSAYFFVGVRDDDTYIQW